MRVQPSYPILWSDMLNRQAWGEKRRTDHLKAGLCFPLSSCGVHRVPWSCGQVYTDTTNRSFRTRLDEQRRTAVCTSDTSVSRYTTIIQSVWSVGTRGPYNLVWRIAGPVHRETIEIHTNKNNRCEESLSFNIWWFPAALNGSVCCDWPYEKRQCCDWPKCGSAVSQLWAKSLHK